MAKKPNRSPCRGAKMTERAKSLLRRVGDTDDSALPLTKSNVKPAQELIDEGLAIIIPHSQGGGLVALNTEGVKRYDELIDSD